MTFFVNLHTLPAGQHMYTIFVADKQERAELPEDFSYEEVDVVASANASRKQVLDAAASELDSLYDMDAMEVIAISDQSTGEFIWKQRGVS